jgi:hypothetical protein
LFRQTTRGEWSTVIDDVCAELVKLVWKKKADYRSPALES